MMNVEKYDERIESERDVAPNVQHTFVFYAQQLVRVESLKTNGKVLEVRVANRCVPPGRFPWPTAQVGNRIDVVVQNEGGRPRKLHVRLSGKSVG